MQPHTVILRGLTLTEAAAITAVLIAAGLTRIKGPLNAADRLASVTAMPREFGDVALVGAGTVLTPAQVGQAFGDDGAGWPAGVAF